MAKYNFLIVGAGLFGATCARLLTDNGYKCLVMERNNIVGGLCATKRHKDIDVHLFGAHVFNTNNDDVWNFVNKFATFHNYTHNVMSMVGEKLYHMPVNMNTFYEMFGIQFPVEAAKKIQDEVTTFKLSHATNFEEQAIMGMGYTVYNKLIKDYTEKLWGKKAGQLSQDIFNGFPIRYTYNNDYFESKYEGIPDEGYTTMIENMLGDDIDVMLNKNFLENREKYMGLADVIIYSGPLDEFCNYIYGPLEWGVVKYDIKDESETTSNMLGIPVLTLPERENTMLQMVEHKWMTPWRSTEEFNNSTVISYVYQDKWTADKYSMYPINTPASSNTYMKYKSFVEQKYPNILFGGRAGIYKPINMSETIELAMGLCKAII